MLDNDEEAEKKQKIAQKKDPDFYVKVELSSFEAALIKYLRQYPFGKFQVTKQYGEPRRCESMGSEILKESDGMKFAIELNTVIIKKKKSGDYSNLP
jgi:hypothetical protein